MDIHALSWDVVFSEGGNAVKDVTIALDVYPGMEEYNHSIKKDPRYYLILQSSNDFWKMSMNNNKLLEDYGNKLMNDLGERHHYRN